MSKSVLFQYAIIWNPTADQAKEGKKAKVVKDIQTILAASADKVTLLAAREIPEEYLDEMDQLDIAVRPF